MPLYSRGTILNSDLIYNQKALWRCCGELENTSKQFSQKCIKEVKAEDEGVRLLYVMQGELATSHSMDAEINVIASGDATTCHIVVLVEEEHGVVSLGHFDECNIRHGLELMIAEVKSVIESKVGGIFRLDMLNLDVHIVGGFFDERHLSWRINESLLVELSSQTGTYNLETLCTCDINNVVLDNGVNSPVIYGVAVNTKSLEVYPATFPGNNSPDIELRHARLYSSSYSKGMYSIYECDVGEVILRPFTYSVPQHYILTYLSLDDESLLSCSSTSPRVEPPGFVDQVRRTVTFIKCNPRPLLTIFQGNTARRYRWAQETHQWELVNNPASAST